jgi:hypothetical protein
MPRSKPCRRKLRATFVAPVRKTAREIYLEELVGSSNTFIEVVDTGSAVLGARPFL